jgi:hypothetical protein
MINDPQIQMLIALAKGKKTSICVDEYYGAPGWRDVFHGPDGIDVGVRVTSISSVIFRGYGQQPATQGVRVSFQGIRNNQALAQLKRIRSEYSRAA